MENTPNNRQTVTLRATDTVEAACTLFEKELGSGGRPEIEQFLGGWEEPERSKLLFELLRLELQYGVVTGETHSYEELLQRFPDHREVVDEVFALTIVRKAEATLTMQSALVQRRVLGEGGLGIVYVAVDQELQRETAVKFIKENLKNDSWSKEQFRLEAEITGRLEHPGIVPVHGLGKLADGRLFYVMRLIRGDRLDEAIAKYYEAQTGSSRKAFKKVLKFHELLNRHVAVCKTIAYAHNRGVIHRDIKPNNIMLGRFGEAIVIDWGLGAHVGRVGPFKEGSEPTLVAATGSGASQNTRGGTPPYMSPEQASGRDVLGPASDIYSLGATLYTILTGKPPYSGHPDDVMEQVQRGEFPRPRQINANISKALESICLKAMALDPQRRYPTALELAEDIERYLADAPVKAYEEPFTRRVSRWARKHRMAAQSGVIVLLFLALAGSTVGALMSRKARVEHERGDVAVEARKNEQQLRKQGLQLSAIFAARTVANQIDLRWRILEKEAADPALHKLLLGAKANPQDEANQAALQQWLVSRVDKDYANVPYRSWAIFALDGTQVARVPSEEAEGKKVESLGKNFAYRDYFHGLGRDVPQQESIQLKPLRQPHNSTVIRSVNGGELAVMLSVPIRINESADPEGVLGMSIELGSFADLQKLPEGQGALLIESRKYYMLDDKGKPAERGEGLVLHHQDLEKQGQLMISPEHLDDSMIKFMMEATQARISQRVGGLENLLPESYRDPLSSDPDGHWLAAYEPVLIESRQQDQQQTGWFVIVQQQAISTSAPK